MYSILPRIGPLDLSPSSYIFVESAQIVTLYPERSSDSPAFFSTHKETRHPIDLQEDVSGLRTSREVVSGSVLHEVSALNFENS